MKKKIITFNIILFLFIQYGFSQGINLDWAVNLDQNSKPAMVIDSIGNTYLCNSYISFSDPSAGSFSDFYVKKIDPNGTVLWQHHFGNVAFSNEECHSITLDNLGNIYIVGDYMSADFDPGPNSYNLSNFSTGANYILKLDSNGNFIWVKSFLTRQMKAVTHDNLNNIYISGFISDTTDFDPGLNSFNVTPITTKDSYVLKLDSNGNFIWVRTNDAPFLHWGQTITSDHNNYIYHSSNNFIEKLDSSGNIIWTNDSIRANSIAIDNNYNLYISSYDSEIQKLDTNGSLLFTKEFDGSSHNVKSLSLDDDNNIYITGQFTDSLDFDPGINNQIRYSQGYYDAFLLKLTAQGDFINIYTFGSTSFDNGNSIQLSENNDIFVAGGFSNTVDFDPSSNIFNLTSSGNQCFLLKLNQWPLNLIELEKNVTLDIFPNPSQDYLNLLNLNDLKVNTAHIIDINGKILKFISKDINSINISELSNGTYFLKLNSEKGIITKKFIKQ